MFGALWIVWCAAFFVIEGVALVVDHRDVKATHPDAARLALIGHTLSAHLRRWIHTDTHTGRTVWLGVSGLFFAWFVVHIATPAGWL